MNIILLIVGMFMDITPAILIFTPIFLPIAISFGMSEIQFGVMLISICVLETLHRQSDPSYL